MREPQIGDSVITSFFDDVLDNVGISAVDQLANALSDHGAPLWDVELEDDENSSYQIYWSPRHGSWVLDGTFGEGEE